jgi:hypothetical protein
MRVRIALVGGLALIAIAIGVTLSRAPVTVIASNSLHARSLFYTRGGGTRCQPGEVLPKGTSAIRVSLFANVGPRVAVAVRSGSRTLTHGEHQAGWGGDRTVTVPLTPLSRSVANASICITLGRAIELIQIDGQEVSVPTAHGRSHREPRLRIEYLRAQRHSWWSQASSVARRMGLGRAPSGTWTVLLLLALMGAVTALSSWVLLRGAPTGNAPSAPPRRTARGPVARLRSIAARVPRAGWACAAIACLSAVSWSLITPPFQSPDEPAHFAYTTQLAERGSLPVEGHGYVPQALSVVLNDLHQNTVRGSPERHPISTHAEQRHLEEDLARPADRVGEGAAGVATSEPPLYYALEAIPYEIGSSGTVLDRLELMRLLSALMAGVTALFGYLFVREALPRAPWAWAVGGLGIALAPLLGAMSGAVNPDAMLYAVCAVVFYLLARGFRRGLTTWLAVAIGAATAVGILTKLNFIAVLPGILVASALLTLRARSIHGRKAYRSLVLVLAIAALPAVVYILANLIAHHPAFGLLSDGIKLTGREGSLSKEISYIWQLYLPRLPGMHNDFPGLSSTLQIWFNRSVGLYGWIDTSFPGWVDTIALVAATLVAMLGLRSLLMDRVALRRRLPELAVYALIGVGVLGLVGADSFLAFGQRSSERAGEYSEPRYLLPLLPLLGAVLVLAARGAGRRWGPTVGTLLVLLILAHELFSQLLVISRFYS